MPRVQKKYKWSIIITAIAVIAMMVGLTLIIIPGAAGKVANWFGTTAEKVKATAVTVVLLATGVSFVSWGVTALALAPVVGAGLIIVGAVLAVYAIWNSGWFGNKTPTITVQ